MPASHMRPGSSIGALATRRIELLGVAKALSTGSEFVFPRSVKCPSLGLETQPKTNWAPTTLRIPVDTSKCPT
jgi:hypothetical protein